jgi:hypothetical protein
MKNEKYLLLKITEVRVNWHVEPDKIIKSLYLEFAYTTRDFSVYKGDEITGGTICFGVGESEFFGELSYLEKYKEFSASTYVVFACTPELFADLLDKREELVGANMSLTLDENQTTIRYASNSPEDLDLIFDLREKRHVPLTSFSLSFAPCTTKTKNGEPVDVPTTK